MYHCAFMKENADGNEGARWWGISTGDAGPRRSGIGDKDDLWLLMAKVISHIPSLPLVPCRRNPAFVEKSQLRRGWRCCIRSPHTMCFPFPFLNLPFPSCSRFFEHGLMCRLDLLFCRSCSLLVLTSSSTRQVCLIRDSIFFCPPMHLWFYLLGSCFLWMATCTSKAC